MNNDRYSLAGWLAFIQKLYDPGCRSITAGGYQCTLYHPHFSDFKYISWLVFPESGTRSGIYMTIDLNILI